MNRPVSPGNISIVLTSTVDPRGVPFMKRADPLVRLADYEHALRRWMQDPWATHIVLVENSAYPLDSLRRIAEAAGTSKSVEFLSIDGQDFPRPLGKGYGETVALTHVLQQSAQLARTTRFLKINGRYYVPNVGRVLSGMALDTQIFCNLDRGMAFSDSRVFGGSLEFLRRFCAAGLEVDDAAGVWLEHVLAKCMLRCIADGMSWRFITTLPRIEGMSATMDRAYSEPAVKQWLKGGVQGLKQRLLQL